jgi:hypothetical protein
MTKRARKQQLAFRAMLLERDGRCLVCGSYLDETTLNPHHVITKKAGGTDDPSNGMSLCTRCHVGVHNGVVTLDQRYFMSPRVLQYILFLHYGYPCYVPDAHKQTARALYGRYKTLRQRAMFGEIASLPTTNATSSTTR